MLKVNNTNIFGILLVSAAANCITILLFKINIFLERNVLMYLLRKDVKMKLIYNGAIRITVFCLIM